MSHSTHRRFLCDSQAAFARFCVTALTDSRE